MKSKCIKQARIRIGASLRELREAENKSQTWVAEKTGLSQHTISKIENGVWNFSIDIVTSYAALFGKTVILENDK